MGGKRNYDEISTRYLGKAYPVTQEPGPAAPAVRKWYSNHPGIDYGVPEGTPIIAPADLDVLGTTSNNIYGNRVAVKDPYTGETMTFSHLKDLPTVSGRIKAGELLGYTGNTGRSTGAHLDVEIKNLASNFNNMATNNIQTNSGSSSGGMEINYDEINRFRNDMIKQGENPEEVDDYLGKKISEIQKRQAEIQDYTNKAIITKEVAGDYKEPAIKLVQPPTTTYTAPKVTAPSVTGTLPDIPQTTTNSDEATLKYNHKLAMDSGDMEWAKKINDQYISEFSTGINEEKKLTVNEQKQVDLKRAKEDMAALSDSILELIDKKEKGEISEEFYKSTLWNLGSQLVTKKKEADNMGASFTSTEKTMMAGSVPIQQDFVPKFWGLGQQFTGKGPVQTGEIVDSPQNLKNKMIMMGKTMRGEKVDINELSRLSSSGDTKKEGPVKELGKNAAKDTGDILVKSLEGIMGIPSYVVDYTRNQIAQGKPANLQGLLGDAAWKMIKGTVEEYNQFFGEPLKGVDENGKNAGQRAVQRMYDKPVTTVLDVVPGVAALKALKGVKGVKNVSKIGMLDDIPKSGAPPAPKTGIIANIKGKAARAVTNASSDDLIRTEQIGKDINSLTTANTNAGKARQLKLKQGELKLANDNFASKADEVIGELPTQTVLEEVMNKINSTTMGKSYGKSVEKVRGEVSSLIGENPLTGELNLTTTKPSLINKARETLNASIGDDWYKRGKPVKTKADRLSYFQDQASRGLRDILAEMDSTGSFDESLRLQHSAIDGYKLMSKKATKTTQPGGGFFTMAAKGARKVSEVPGSAIGRAIIGKGSKLTTDVAKGAPIDYSGLKIPDKYLPKQQGTLPNIPQAGLEPPTGPSTNLADIQPGTPLSTGPRPAPQYVLDILKKQAKKGDVSTSYKEFSKFYILPEIGTFSKK